MHMILLSPTTTFLHPLVPSLGNSFSRAIHIAPPYAWRRDSRLGTHSGV